MISLKKHSPLKNRPVRVGLVGFGWWGKTIAHQLKNTYQLRLDGVAEVSPELRQSMSSDPDLKDIKIHPDAQALFEQDALEAVILCSPHLQHAEQIQNAAKRGLHVFCEKPLCLNLADAELAISTCQSNNLVLGIGHERRFEPAIKDLRRMINEGKLGEILQIEANFSQDKFFALPKDNWRLSNAHAPVGPLTATGIHLVDLSIALLGPCKEVWARLATLGSDFENGDTLGIMMGFESGASALISAVLATPFEGRFAVYGSKGWVEIRDRTHPENPSGWDIKTTLRGQPQTSQFVPPHASVLANLEAFSSAIRGDAPYPVSAGEMLANVATLEAIMSSVKTRKIQHVEPASIGFSISNKF
jgi:predicted dehydrogenase